MTRSSVTSRSILVNTLGNRRRRTNKKYARPALFTRRCTRTDTVRPRAEILHHATWRRPLVYDPSIWKTVFENLFWKRYRIPRKAWKQYESTSSRTIWGHGNKSVLSTRPCNSNAAENTYASCDGLSRARMSSSRTPRARAVISPRPNYVFKRKPRLARRVAVKYVQKTRRLFVDTVTFRKFEISYV